MEIFESGDTDFALAFNWNETTVDKFNPDTTSDGKVKRLEKGMPNYRSTFTVSQDWDAVSMFVRANYFGNYFATHADDTSFGWSGLASSEITMDLEVNFFLSDQITLSAGANNILDQKAEKLKPAAYGVVGGVYYESGPFDYNGGFYYVKASYNF
jgi:iron complex outermembrane receptor protein